MTIQRRLAWAAILAIGAGVAAHAAGRSDVADAVMKGDRTALDALIRQKADVNAPQADGATAVHWAVYRHEPETLDRLISAGAGVNVANREGATPIAMAALYGDTAIIARLLEAGADARTRTVNGETLVMFAARNGNPEAIGLLARAGADVNAKENLRGTTALMWAAEQKHPDAVKTLVELGADVSARSGPAGLPRNYIAPRIDRTAVDAAARRYADAAAAGRTYQEQLDWETAQGAKIPIGFRGTLNAGGNRGERGASPPGAPGPPVVTPVAPTPPRPQAAPASAPAATSDDSPDDGDVVVAGLVGAGGGGLTALIFAAREGDAESVQHLLDGGAIVNQTSEYGWTPLLTATNNRHYRLATTLLEHGADPNIANKGGWTPLYLATDNANIEGGDYPVPKPDMDHHEFITILLERGADPNRRVRDNTLTRTIFTMQWFYENGAVPFVRASQSSDLALMRLLLEYGADAFLATENGDTALTASAGIGWVEGVTYERAPKDNIEAVRMLLDLGLDPNHANREGRTALMGAALKGRSEVVQLLVDRGAKLETHDGGSRDTDNSVSILAGHTWQAIDYADGLVRVGVQSAISRPETAALIRRLMTERGLPVPPPDRVIESICVVSICQERARP